MKFQEKMIPQDLVDQDLCLVLVGLGNPSEMNAWIVMVIIGVEQNGVVDSLNIAVQEC